MPKQLEGFRFDREREKRKAKQAKKKQRYDWDLLFNGRTWMLIKGEDFPGNPEYLRRRIYEQATQRRVTVTTMMDGENIILKRTGRVHVTADELLAEIDPHRDGSHEGARR